MLKQTPCFFKVHKQQKARENVGLMLNGKETQDLEKIEALNATFASVFIKGFAVRDPLTPETRGKAWSKEDVLLVGEDQARKHVSKLDICKSMGPNMMHPQVLRELVGVMTSFVMICKDIPDSL